MRRLAPRLADAEVHRRLAEINRHKLAMNIGHMQQRDVAGGVEAEQFGFGQALLRQGTRERAFAGRERGRRSADLKNFPTTEVRPNLLNAGCPARSTSDLRSATPDTIRDRHIPSRPAAARRRVY